LLVSNHSTLLNFRPNWISQIEFGDWNQVPCGHDPYLLLLATIGTVHLQ